MEYSVLVKQVDRITHDVLKIRTSKPEGYFFVPGQATELSIDEDNWRNEKRPFTFTCLPSDRHLEFIIKTYPSRNGVTNQLLKIQRGDSLNISEAFGAIAYKGEGIFIAGGAGVTPFISILRHLSSSRELGDNKLIFANKTREDIILNFEFQEMLRDRFVNILSEDPTAGYTHHGFLSRKVLEPFLRGNNKMVYLCGPDAMMEAVEAHLSNLDVPASSIIKEVFSPHDQD